MRGSRGSWAVGAFVAAVLVLASCGRAEPGTNLLGFVRHPNAVQFPAEETDWAPEGSGIRLLTPVGQCALGIGIYQNGYRSVGANWVGDADCARFTIPAHGKTARNDSPLAKGGGWDGAGLSANAITNLADGSVIGVGSEIVHRDEDGTVHRLADLHLPSRSPKQETGDTGRATSIVVAGDRLLVGGGQTVGEHSTPLMWLSTDKGATVSPVKLPVPAGQPGDDYVGTMNASGDKVVATGLSVGSEGKLATWFSADAGRTWSSSTVDKMPAHSLMKQVLRTETGWLAVGGAQNQPVVLTSADGKQWTVVDTRAMGAGGVIGAAGGKTDNTVLIGQVPRTGNQKSCGVAWVSDGNGSWHRADLGCEDPPTAVTTLADGRILVVGNRDLWLRE